MTDQEYTSLAIAVRNNFPSIGAWFAKLTQAQQAAQRDRNRRCLIGCDHADAVRAIDEILASDADPWPYDSDKERVAAILAKRANEFRAKRQEAARVDEYRATSRFAQRTGTDANSLSAGGLTKSYWDLAMELVELKKRPDWTRADTDAWLDEHVK